MFLLFPHFINVGSAALHMRRISCVFQCAAGYVGISAPGEQRNGEEKEKVEEEGGVCECVHCSICHPDRGL